ncbi:hypothetical protein GW933_02620 [Candidatus Falkowbacteria bacterium]|uniref:Uncharacterized protein n=1 Tax=Candidatus Buchananbacteria bacterium CG10_big_fil_rev_8_21_14_0_10_33_19 TaxID=1974525 RepID=A0A2H0W4C4_9BACT|nr:hypothetical protein [Candidatus Falkowbacteria bacterium]PIS06205.1 MAG: hypothetical protein COT80_01375 [Candidatus Buchananbacteria bacterium CG10_big_fil_rev_8_21_14_0_10_33_19]
MINKVINKIFIISFFILVFFVFVLPVKAQNKVEVNFFHSKTCPVCAQESKFLDGLESRDSNLVINRYEVSEASSISKLNDFYKQYNVPESNWGLVPVTFIGGQAYLGFGEKTLALIEDQLTKLQSGESGDYGTQVSDGTFEKQVSDQLDVLKQRKINIPFFGEFEVAGMAPFTLSLMVGVLDGFNACAMVALSILLAILIGTNNRKRVVLIGGTFIFVSGLVYYVFIAAWLNVFLFLGYLKIITYIISAAVIVFAVFLLKDYFNDVICKLCNVKNDKADGLLTRFQKYLYAKANKTVSSEMPIILVLLAISVIAVGINMIELFCSLGFPLAYTKILATHNLPTYQYYLNLLVYIFFYMLDDLLIFLVAVVTLRITKVSDKYLKFVKLASGVVLLLLGLIMLFRPEILTF